MDEIALPSFAKINLLLRVTGRRPDGYHDLESIFQTIDLHDRILFRFSDSSDLQVALDVGESKIPSDGRNLIHKACVAFNEIHPISKRIEVKIEKKIPVESGLGGGSSNAACALIALSRYLGWPLSRHELANVAGKLGADVPFFLYGGTALGTERGDQITPLADLDSNFVLLVFPGVSCSTTAIYGKYDESGLLTQRRNSIKIQLEQRPEFLRDFVSQIENDLETVVFTLYPELDSIKKRLVEAGARAAALTGSGSALFGFFASAEDLEKAAGRFPGSCSTRFVSRDEYLTRLGRV